MFTRVRILLGSLKPNSRLILSYSHPNGSAEPSKVDLSRAWETDLIWLIIALEGGRTVDQRAYKVEIPKERFVEIDIRVIISQ